MGWNGSTYILDGKEASQNDHTRQRKNVSLFWLRRRPPKATNRQFSKGGRQHQGEKKKRTHQFPERAFVHAQERLFGHAAGFRPWGHPPSFCPKKPARHRKEGRVPSNASSGSEGMELWKRTKPKGSDRAKKTSLIGYPRKATGWEELISRPSTQEFLQLQGKSEFFPPPRPIPLLFKGLEIQPGFLTTSQPVVCHPSQSPGDFAPSRASTSNPGAHGKSLAFLLLQMQQVRNGPRLRMPTASADSAQSDLRLPAHLAGEWNMGYVGAGKEGGRHNATVKGRKGSGTLRLRGVLATSQNFTLSSHDLCNVLKGKQNQEWFPLLASWP